MEMDDLIGRASRYSDKRSFEFIENLGSPQWPVKLPFGGSKKYVA